MIQQRGRRRPNVSSISHRLTYQAIIESAAEVLEEDLEIAPYLQKSANSRAFDGGRLSFQERRIYHWHEELDRRIGHDEIPASLSVTPRMEQFIERRA